MPKPSPTKPPLSDVGSILFIRPGGIGDAVLLIPTIRAFKASFPETKIYVLAEKRNASVFSLCCLVERVLLYDSWRGIIDAFKLKYDVVIDSEQWHRLSAVLANLIGNCVIGFATNNRERLLTHAISYFQDDYEAESFCKLITPFSICESDQMPVPFLDVPDTVARNVWELLDKCVGQSFVVIFPGASIVERHWGAENFRELVKRCSDRGIVVAVVGGNAELIEGNKITVGLSGILNLVGITSLVETSAVIEKASVVLSSDSGILHIAVGLGIPTVSLFGPGREKKWAPRGDNHIVINKHLPCSPCTTFGYTPKCPSNARCMAEISVDEVEQAVLTLLDRNNFVKRQQKP
nr:glycosyltransferase family 9 protein [Geobacter hydrogenophilus]